MTAQIDSRNAVDSDLSRCSTLFLIIRLKLFSLSNLLAETQSAEKLGKVTRTFFIADTHFKERHPKSCLLYTSMRYLREAGKEFAQAYPDRAAMLNLDKPGARDRCV